MKVDVYCPGCGSTDVHPLSKPLWIVVKGCPQYGAEELEHEYADTFCAECTNLFEIKTI